MQICYVLITLAITVLASSSYCARTHKPQELETAVRGPQREELERIEWTQSAPKVWWPKEKKLTVRVESKYGF